MAGLDVAEAYLESLLRTERITGRELSDYQAKLLRALLKPTLGETPFYAGRAAPPDDLAPGSSYWLAQPFITRRDLVENFDAFRPRSFASLHGVITPIPVSEGRPRASMSTRASSQSAAACWAATERSSSPPPQPASTRAGTSARSARTRCTT